MAKNKVEFGISNLHVGTFAVADDGTVTMGTPYHQKGARGFTPEQDSNENTAYADDMAYWSEYTEGQFSGDMTTMLFDDDFKTQFLGYVRTNKGGLGQVKGATKPNVYIAFEIKGDAEKRRAIFYNCALGSIGRLYETIEDQKEPVNETLPITCTGDNTSGLFKEVLKPGDAGYDTLFTNPSAPGLAE